MDTFKYDFDDQVQFQVKNVLLHLFDKVLCGLLAEY